MARQEIITLAQRSQTIYPEMLVNGTTQLAVKVLQTKTVVKKRNYVVVMRFRRGVSYNI